MIVPKKWFSSLKSSASIIAAIILIASSLITLSTAALAVTQQADRVLEPVDMQNLIFIWASGTASIQQKASQICRTDNISTANCASISADVRSAWLELMQVDPASLGRIGARENPTARAQVYNRLAGKLSSLTQAKEALLFAQTQQMLQQMNAVTQQTNNQSTSKVQTSYTVWATSYIQYTLPNGLKAKTSPYVALPDAYLKYANWGTLSNIPSIYQPYYAPKGTKTTWTVTIALTNGTKKISKVLITDVGPWNEDDNWWDANGTSTTLPSSCPVSTTLIAPNATSNPLVNGICPNGKNLRRVYYYVLNTHDGLPFFQPSGNAPSGNFTNGNLRSGTFDKNLANQSSIDLSPAVDKALGWTYPSSGLIKVNVSALP